MRAITLGPAALPTLALDVLHFAPGETAGRLRETSHAIYAVMRGSGAAEIDGQHFPSIETAHFAVSQAVRGDQAI